jgi:hypothetical protein
VGGVLMISPEAALTVVSGETPDRRARIFARVLGARHIIQAVALWLVPTPGASRVGAAIDAAHGLSTLWLLALPNRRRLAQLNCLSAGSFALAGLALARTADADSRHALEPMFAAAQSLLDARRGR